jgi:hypothetical protein
MLPVSNDATKGLMTFSSAHGGLFGDAYGLLRYRLRFARFEIVTSEG